MKNKNSKYSIEELYTFAEYLKTSTLKDTARHFDIDYHYLKKILTQHGLREPKKRFKVKKNDFLNYFENINTHEKAYYLGLLLSDGSIQKGVYTNIISIALQLSDKYILENFIRELGIDNKISIYKNSAKISIASDKMYSDLRNWGFVERKSVKDFSVPNIPLEFINSFILGYFDGDGCITKKNTGYFSVSICCNSELFLTEVKQILENANIICRPVTKETGSRKNPIYVLYLSKKENHLKFYDFLYKDCSLYLFRKYNKFKEIPR